MDAVRSILTDGRLHAATQFYIAQGLQHTDEFDVTGKESSRYWVDTMTMFDCCATSTWSTCDIHVAEA